MILKFTPPNIEIISKAGLRKFILNPHKDDFSYVEEEIIKLSPEGIKGISYYTIFKNKLWDEKTTLIFEEVLSEKISQSFIECICVLFTNSAITTELRERFANFKKTTDVKKLSESFLDEFKEESLKEKMKAIVFSELITDCTDKLYFSLMRVDDMNDPKVVVSKVWSL